MSDPIRLASVELREIRLPLREPFRISSGVVSERRILLLLLTDHDGIGCWAECVAGELPNYSSETVETAWLALTRWFIPRLLGRPTSAPEADALLAHEVRGHRMARAALEMGMWHLASVRAGVPLAQLIGGVRTHVDVGVSLGIQATPEALVQRALAAQRAGYRKIKLKIQPGADISFVASVRSALGDDAAIMVDANNAYTLDDAATLVQLDDFGLTMIEQPLDHEDIVRHAELQRLLRTPICLDESITSVDRAHDMIALGAGRIVNIKPGRVGGFTQSLAIHDLCAAHNVPVWCGGMLESGIGRGFNVALAALPNFTMPGDVSPSARYWERDVVVPEWTMEDGRVRVPTTPGTGVEVDTGFIDDVTVKREVVAR